MSASDFRGLLFEPVMALPRLPLSNNASTASCSIRFSFRTIISGAFKSSSRFNLLFLLITRRYKSFKSEVAKRPPSSGTKGRRSGGKTGRTVITIHSGLLPESTNASKSFKRLDNFFNLVSELVAGISSLNRATSASTSISFIRD